MRVLVRLHGEPMGYLSVPRGGAASELKHLVGMAWDQFGRRIRSHLSAEGWPDSNHTMDGGRPPGATTRCPSALDLPASGEADLVSVIVCTRDRSEILEPCLQRLTELMYPNLEFVIVDNAASDDATKTIVESMGRSDPRFRYVVEHRPGLSYARNKGLAQARGQYVAYTDDDVAVDPGWVGGLIRGFRRRDDVGCVTGLVCTAAITSPAEAYFDARVALWSCRCEPQLYDLGRYRQPGPLYPYSAGIYGTGANFACDRATLIELGGFDEALGTGTRTRGGEDLDLFVRVLRSGRAIRYEPSALVWHHHRADSDALLRQMYGYGTGLTALLTKLLLQPSTRNDVLRRVVPGLRRIVRIGGETSARLSDSQLSDGAVAPKGAWRREFVGFMAGPFLYFLAKREARRVGRT
jgi:GT2 family glycosyltransferase